MRRVLGTRPPVIVRAVTAQSFFELDSIDFDYEPFPIGLARPLMAPAVYKDLVDAFPPIERLTHYDVLGRPGSKYTLSEREQPDAYREFVRHHPVWRDFHAWVKSDGFIDHVLASLTAQHIDLGFRRRTRARRAFRNVRALARGGISPRDARLRTRFEFSALPADGGMLLPHTDAPSKIVTLVVSMLRGGEWNPAWGGGLDVCRPKDIRRFGFNWLNELAEFADMEVVRTFPFEPNQAIVFVKTYDSWHAVRPMTGAGSKDLRRTLTIVIETPT